MKRLISGLLAGLAALTFAVQSADATPRKPLVLDGGGNTVELPSGDTLQTRAATTANASLNLPHGTAPSSPVDGDMWSTSAGLYMRINGVTVGPYGAGGGTGTVTSVTCGTGLTGGTFTTSGTCALSAPVSIANGGTGASTAGGGLLDNITGFSSTGFLTRTGSNTYSFQSLTNGITLSNLAQAGANTVLANPTGSTANLTAHAVPSCSGASDALTWTSNSGFGCNTITGSGGGTIASSVDVQTFTANGTWTKPSGAKVVKVIAIGHGGAGGSGAAGDNTQNRSGGGSGAGGEMKVVDLNPADLAATVSVTVPTAPTGGAGVASGSGNPGGNGADTFFGTIVRAQPGGSGSGGTTSSGSSGSSISGGSGAMYAGANGATGSTGNGNAGPTFLSSQAGGGPGGGGGGGVNTSSAAGTGGAGGRHVWGATTGSGGGASGGATAGASGSNGANLGFLPGSGGGGGAGGVSANGGAGGAGGYGAGGGGGGAARTGFNSGKGGDGGPAVVWVITYF